MKYTRKLDLPQDWYMSWFFSTQAANNICVTLKDSSKTYVPAGGKPADGKCRENTTFGVLSQGFAEIADTGLELIVEIDQSNKIRARAQDIEISQPGGGANIVKGVVISFEDATDNDFNDLYAVIMAWTSKG